MLGTSEGWSVVHFDKRTSERAYYILDRLNSRAYLMTVLKTLFIPKHYSKVGDGFIVLLCRDYGHPERAFFRNSQIFGLGQTNGAENVLGILGIFDQFISTHFGTVGSLSTFSFIINHYFSKKPSFYIQIPIIYLGVGVEFGPETIKNLDIVCP